MADTLTMALSGMGSHSRTGAEQWHAVTPTLKGPIWMLCEGQNLGTNEEARRPHRRPSQ